MSSDSIDDGEKANRRKSDAFMHPVPKSTILTSTGNSEESANFTSKQQQEIPDIFSAKVDSQKDIPESSPQQKPPTVSFSVDTSKQGDQSLFRTEAVGSDNITYIKSESDTNKTSFFIGDTKGDLGTSVENSSHLKIVSTYHDLKRAWLFWDQPGFESRVDFFSGT